MFNTKSFNRFYKEQYKSQHGDVVGHFGHIANSDSIEEILSHIRDATRNIDGDDLNNHLNSDYCNDLFLAVEFLSLVRDYQNECADEI